MTTRKKAQYTIILFLTIDSALKILSCAAYRADNQSEVMKMIYLKLMKLG